MAARGQAAKGEVMKKLQEVFPNSFIVDKVLRIPMVEDGQTVEIKVALTAAKDVIGGTPVPVETAATVGREVSGAPTAEERARVESMIRALGGRIK